MMTINSKPHDVTTILELIFLFFNKEIDKQRQPSRTKKVDCWEVVTLFGLLLDTSGL
jgi:hypothetical protein